MFRRTARSWARRSAAAVVLVAAVVATGTGSGAGSAGAAPAAAVDRSALLDIPSCTGFLGAYALGAKFQVGSVTVQACGPRPNYTNASDPLQTVLPYVGSIASYPGYQCVELSARYLAAAYGARTPAGTMNGAQVVSSYARRYPKLFVRHSNGVKGYAPKRGDVMSFSRNKHFSDVGHTGVVLASHVNSKGNGTVTDMEQNYGGAGGASGKHVYTVKKWHVIWKQKPYVRWLHARH